MYTKNEKIRELINEKKILITAHRGSCGGNLTQNHHLTYKAALLQGADIIEMDVIKSKDDVYYAFHSKQEKKVLNYDGVISDLTSEEIDRLEVRNWLEEPSGLHLERMDDILDMFDDKCLVNIDRSWFFYDDIIKHLNERKHDNILIKTPVKEEYLKLMETTDMMYMPIIYKKEEFEECLKYNLNLAAVEIIFRDLECDMLTVVMDYCKEHGIATFVNAETLGADERFNISANIGDNLSIEEGFDKGWGKLIELGFDIIQTDWAGILNGYLENTVRNVK